MSLLGQAPGLSACRALNTAAQVQVLSLVRPMSELLESATPSPGPAPWSSAPGLRMMPSLADSSGSPLAPVSVGYPTAQLM